MDQHTAKPHLVCRIHSSSYVIFMTADIHRKSRFLLRLSYGGLLQSLCTFPLMRIGLHTGRVVEHRVTGHNCQIAAACAAVAHAGQLGLGHSLQRPGRSLQNSTQSAQRPCTATFARPTGRLGDTSHVSAGEGATNVAGGKAIMQMESLRHWIKMVGSLPSRGRSSSGLGMSQETPARKPFGL